MVEIEKNNYTEFIHHFDKSDLGKSFDPYQW